MKYGARNQVTGKVTSIKRGDVMSLIKFEVAAPASTKPVEVQFPGTFGALAGLAAPFLTSRKCVGPG